MIEELTAKYEELKGVIEVLPTNTKYNRKRKLDYIADEEKNDEERINNVTNEIEERLAKYKILKENPEISKLDSEIEKCEIVNEWNPYNTPYEKMHLDYYLYQLHRYYKEDLESVNACIKKIIESFKNVNINLTCEDFNFNTYSREYMEKLLSDASFEELKACFETLYWKNPEIIKTIELNFKSLYLKNEKQISKYYESRHQEFLKSHQDSELYNMRVDLTKKLEDLKQAEQYLNFQKFINGEYQLSDYKDYDAKRDRFFSEGTYNYSKLCELYSLLNEYKIIVNYKYLFTDMKSKLENKAGLKNARSATLKKINSEESKLRKINNKQDKKGLFGKKKNDEKWIFDYKDSLNNIATLYDELDTSNFSELVYTKLSQDSDLLEIMKLITSNYLYFVERTYEQNADESINIINEKFEELRHFINTSSFYLLDNVCLLDELQLKMLIVDKYNLEHINLTTDQLMDDSLDNTINEIHKLIEYENILKSGLSLEDITLYLEYQKLSEEKNKG